MARPPGRGPDRGWASRARPRRDGPQRDCGAPWPRAERCLDRARIRLAEDRWPFDAGRRCSGGRPGGGYGFFLATGRHSGGATGRPAAGRRSSSERGERTRHPALAMAGARCAGRRWPPFLFLVDAQPDAVRSARRKHAGAGDASAGDRRAGACPAACSFARASSASSNPAAASAGSPTGNPGRRSSPGSFDGRTSDGAAAFASAGRACSCHESGIDVFSAARARSLDGGASDGASNSATAFASTNGASARRADFAADNRTVAADSGSYGGRNG